MAKSRLEILIDEEAEAQAERARFEELADQYRQQGHLPPGGDQSWREREALRRAAYDKSYAPPQNDQARREREAMLFAPAGEEAGTAAIEDESPEMREPVLRPVPVAKGGQGGTILIFVLVAAIGLGITALAYPEMLTAAYWRTPAAQNDSAMQPVPQRAVQPAPAIQPTTAPTQEASPPAAPAPAPDLKRTPVEPAAPAQDEVPVIDARPPADAAPAPKPNPKPRAPARDDRGAGGFYAKAPGPDGILRDTYFPADPKADPKSDSRTPAREAPAKPDAGGFYAKAPGPNGTLEYRFFPSKPPPR